MRGVAARAKVPPRPPNRSHDPMPPAPSKQPTRFAIQKARGKGWTTLEVGEELAQAEARFELMVKVNPRAYFRLIQLDYNPDSGYEGMEFNWTLIHLHDPNKGGKAGTKVKTAKGRAKQARGKDKVALPVRFYLAVVLVGLLLGVLVYLRYGVS
ncbi:MAG TPA: hypothetical protein VD978_32980 [Azospirillum sp.]|nr:hypothetical protein [Azospirillum sp.]